MGYVIALAGKGGTGKTTVAALIVRVIKEKKLGSILVVDADPNNNLCEALGLELKETIGGIVDDIAQHPEKIPAGISKDRFIEFQIQTAVIEGDGFDVLTMGIPEGPGCYCYVNNVLRNVMAKLIKEYDYVVIDNEAGLEHLSRRTTRTADALVIVSDSTVVGLRSAKRIMDLVKDLKISTKKNLLLLNRSDKAIAKEKIIELGLHYIGNIPQDKQIEQMSTNGNSLMELKNDAKSLLVLRELGDTIWQSN
jgi:CO dehydrogenase maturation factor